MPPKPSQRSTSDPLIVINRILSGEKVYGRWMDDLTLQRFDQAYCNHHQIFDSGLRVVGAEPLEAELLAGELIGARESSALTGSVALNTGNHWVYMHIQFDAAPVNITIYDSRRVGSIGSTTVTHIQQICGRVLGDCVFSFQYLNQQKDGWSCGYWTLKNYLAIAHGDDISPQNDVNAVFNTLVQQMYNLYGAAKVEQCLTRPMGVFELHSFLCAMKPDQQARFNNNILAPLSERNEDKATIVNLNNLCTVRVFALRQIDAYRLNWFVSSDRTVRAKALYESIQEAQSMQAIVDALMQAWHGMEEDDRLHNQRLVKFAPRNSARFYKGPGSRFDLTLRSILETIENTVQPFPQISVQANEQYGTLFNSLPGAGLPVS